MNYYYAAAYVLIGMILGRCVYTKRRHYAFLPQVPAVAVFFFWPLWLAVNLLDWAVKRVFAFADWLVVLTTPKPKKEYNQAPCKECGYPEDSNEHSFTVKYLEAQNMYHTYKPTGQ